MYTNADITLYSFQDGKYLRTVINNVFWNEVKESNTLKSGLNTADSVKIFVPLSSKNRLEVATGKDIVVKGKIDYEIDNTSQATQSSSLKYLKETHNFVTINMFDKKLFGSKKMQHYVLSCR